MKHIFLCSILCTIAFYSQLAAQKKELFDYPEDTVSENSKKAFAKQFNQGQILYTISCAGCHNLKESKKEIIPDFSMPQLMDYEMRLYPVHMERLNDSKVSDEEMQKIILFLRFKKKSGVPFKVPVK